MTAGLNAAVANSLLAALANATNYTAPTAFWVKLHIGDPGSAGTANAAGNTTRKQATFASPSGGSVTTSADIAWTSVSTTETYTHVSFWDASTAGNFIASSALAASKAVSAGDTFTISAGSLSMSLAPVAA